MSRLIVSGCSFTNYWHPTWAWFMSSAFDETYNYGQSGAGNEYIYHSIIDADTDLQLNENDTVVIAWSGYHRFDRFNSHDGHLWWKTNGDWSFDPNFKTLEQFVNDDGWTRKTVNYITATARYLKSKNIKYVFTSLYNLQDRNSEAGSKVHTDTYVVKLLADIYNDNFVYTTGLANHVYQQRAQNKSLVKTSHPNLSEHQDLAMGIAAKLGVTIDIHTDLAQYDILLETLENIGKGGNLLRSLHDNNFAHILTKSRAECIPSTVEKYYPISMQEYKKVLYTTMIK